MLKKMSEASNEAASMIVLQERERGSTRYYVSCVRYRSVVVVINS